jgi:LmbE family N-acetylglucosaminyl deacetylase
MNYPATFCIDISDTVEQKHAAIACYKSQFVGLSSAVPDQVKAVSAYFGTRIGSAHAEPFFTQETLGFSGLDQLF